jgi:tetratricopeptide (TPR) repeat protein
LEEFHEDNAAQIAPQLARHFELAELPVKARQYLRYAGEQAAEGFANSTALDYLNKALELTPEEEFEERFLLLAARARIFDILGARETQRTDLAALTDICDNLPNPTLKRLEVGLRWGKFFLDISEYDAVIDEASQVVEEIKAEKLHIPGAEYLLVDAYLLWGRALFLCCDPEKAREVREVLEHANEVANDYAYLIGQARALEILGTVSWSQGEYHTADDYLGKALKLAHDNEDLNRKWSVLNNLGVVASARQDYAQAIQFYENGLEIVRKIGLRLGESTLLSNLGEVFHYLGYYDRSRKYMADSLAIREETNDRVGQGISQMNLSEAYRDVGDFENARAFSEGALEILREISYPAGETNVLENMGRIELSSGDLDRALKFGEEALEIAEEIGSVKNQVASLTVIGASHLQMGDLDKSQEAYSRARTLCDELDIPVYTTSVLVGLAQLELGRGSTKAQKKAREHLDDVFIILQDELSSELVQTIPLGVHLACIKALSQIGDPRSNQLTEQAYHELKSRAGRISDLSIRFSYLEDVIEHVEIQRQYKKLGQNAA